MLKTLLVVAFGSVAGLAVETGCLTPRVLLLLVIGAGGLLALFISWSDLQQPTRLWTRLRAHRAELELVGMGGVAFILLLTTMFSSVSVVDGRFVNVIAHGTGLVTGIAVSGAVIAAQTRL